VSEGSTGRHARARQPSPWRWPLLAAATYLVLGVGVWWTVWSAAPGSTSVCGCGDAARFLWFLEWPAFALAHGHSPLFSTFLNHPTGINLLDDTSVLGLGVPLAPLTLLAGPVVTMNVALLLAPVASSLAMYALLRRLVARPVIALVLGAAYGFSTFVIDPSSAGQLNLAFIAVPPLIVLVLDEVIRRRRWPPRRAGMLLGLLVAWQFFLSPEILLLLAFGCLAAVVPVALVLRDARVAGDRTVGHHLAVAGSWAAGVAVLLLAYPTWWYFAGPAHLSGSVWGPGAQLWRWGSTLEGLVWHAGSPYGLAVQRLFGVVGPELPSYSYLGLGLVLAAVVGLVVLRRDRVLQLAMGVGAVAALLSLAPGRTWTPWSALRHLPLLENVAEYRFGVLTLLCVVVAAARAVDGGLDAVAGAGTAPRPGRATALAGALCGLLLLPTVITLAPVLPLRAVPATQPTWFATVGAHLPPGQVLLVYPAPFSGLQASQAWQARDQMRWAQAGVGGPAGTRPRAGRGAVGRGWQLLDDASFPLVPAPRLRPRDVADVDAALRAWGVTMVVVPDQEHLGPGSHARSTAWAVSFFTAALGAAPHRQPGAWVWLVGPRTGVSLPLVAAAGRCGAHPERSATAMLACLGS